MVARLLRWELAALLLAFSLALYFAGLGIPYLAPAAFAAMLLLYGLLTLATFWIAGAISQPLPRQRISRAFRLFFREWLTFFALFVIIQPFPFFFRGVGGRDRKNQGGKVILLVHGYKCNSALWFWLKPQLLRAGHDVATIDLEPAYASLDRMTRQLHRHIETLSAERTDRITIIAHSMGGLAARACVETFGEGPVEKIITIGTPHNGTQLAYLGRGKNTRDMEPQSRWLKSLPPQWDKAIPFVSIRSRHDNFVSPQESAFLPGALNVELEGLGHLTMVTSAEVLEVLRKALADVDAPFPFAGEDGGEAAG